MALVECLPGIGHGVDDSQTQEPQCKVSPEKDCGICTFKSSPKRWRKMRAGCRVKHPIAKAKVHVWSLDRDPVLTMDELFPLWFLRGKVRNVFFLTSAYLQSETGCTDLK